MKQTNAVLFLSALFACAVAYSDEQPASPHLTSPEQIEAEKKNTQIAAAYMTRQRAPTFLLMDERVGRLFLVSNGRVERSFIALSGRKSGDEIGEYVTPAGIFPLLPRDNGIFLATPELLKQNGGAAIHEMLDIKGENRAGRLNSAAPDDNRISHGCINLSKDDYAAVKEMVQGKTLYLVVLPEDRPFILPPYLPPVWQALGHQVHQPPARSGL